MVPNLNLVGNMMTDEKWLEELQKCMNSPYYLFTNYIMIDNQKVTTLLSEKEFNTIFHSYTKKKDTNGK